MSFNNGVSSYGYDQIYIDPSNCDYTDYTNSILKPSNSAAQPTLRHSNPNTGNYEMAHQPVYYPPTLPKYSAVDGNYKKIEDLEKEILEIRHKNDICMVIMVLIIIYILVQINNLTNLNTRSLFHYNPSMVAPVV